MLVQVELYSDYEPSRLMGFLISSQSYGLEAAHELCKRKGLVREQVSPTPLVSADSPSSASYRAHSAPTDSV